MSKFQLEHISISQIKTFSRCELQWYYRYIKGMKIPPNGNMICGSAAHIGFEKIYTQKMIEDKYNLSECLDATAEYVDYSDVKEEIDWGEQSKSDTKDVAVGLIKCYSQLRIPDRIKQKNIEGVEIKLNATFTRSEKEKIKIKLRPDLILADGVDDCKTIKRTPSKVEVADRLQTDLYKIALKKKKSNIHYLIKKKEPTAIVIPCPDIDNFTIRIVQDIMFKVFRGIKGSIRSGDFIPTGLTHPWACGMCGYADQKVCPYYKLAMK